VTVRAAFAVPMIVVLFAALAARALACGDGMPKNLVAGPRVGAALVDAFVTAHPRLHLAAQDVDRVTGHTYYGTFGGDWYAVATFATASGTRRPTILMHHPGRKWHVIRQTGGAVCGRYVPGPLLALWSLAPLRGTDCYLEPA
jgi:hypothetical protein